jgi:predicted SprT family Zn-dependent metalloprotease
MGRSTPQLEFRWTSWLRVFKLSAPVQPVRPVKDDSGLTAWCKEAAANLGLPELARKVRVSWNPRMQTTAGRAWWPDRCIELNPKLRQCEPDQLWRTLKHELAHLVAYERCGRRRIDPHGAEWQTACADLGIAGEEPYHTLPFKRRRVKRNHAYTCPNCSETIRRVKPIQRAVACYSCCRKFNRGAYDDRFRLVKIRQNTLIPR